MKTEEEIKSIAHEIDNEHETKHYAKKYSNYEDGINILNKILNNWIGPNNCLSPIGQKVVIEVMSKCGWEVDKVLPKISNEYVKLLDEALSKCPFSKQQARQFAVEHLTNTKHIVERRSFWDWLRG